MRRQRGFSLLELLIVVAIILVIAAIAIPNLLQARISANEASAVGSVSAMRSAEVTYYDTYTTVGYSALIANLGGASPCTPSPTTACLIDNSLATSIPGSGGKSGFVFAATGIATGGASFNTAYTIGASPLLVNQSGNRDFCANNDGVIRSQMASPGDTPVNTLAACNAFPVSQ